MRFPFLCFLIFHSYVYAQMHRFVYEVDYKKDSANQTKTKEYFLLDVLPDETYYYSRDYYVMDSIMQAGAVLDMNVFSGIPNMSPVTYHKNDSNRYDYYEVVEYNTLHLTSDESQSWKLEVETKTVDGIRLQKARSNWGKRSWEAWFAPEIPFSSGPEKFHGLPGIIFEIKDDRDNFHFKLIKSEELKNTRIPEPLLFIKQASVPVTLEKYKKTKMMWYDDPLSFLKNSEIVLTDDNWAMLSDGTKVTNKNTREVIEQQRKRLKANNNPLDLNLQIHYPNK